MNKDKWKFIVQLVLSVLTAIATTLEWGRADKQKIRIERTNAICVAQKSIENTLQKHSSNNLEYRFLISYNDYIAMCKQLKYKVFWHIITDKIVG